jgi:hypothetical protein
MTSKQLTQLFDELVEFTHWMEDRPLELGLDPALTVVKLAVIAERNAMLLSEPA